MPVESDRCTRNLRPIAAYIELMKVTPFLISSLSSATCARKVGTTRRKVMYDRARTQIAVKTANDAIADAGVILFAVDHGDPVEALAIAEAVVADRPFLESHEAHAWALHSFRSRDRPLRRGSGWARTACEPGRRQGGMKPLSDQ